MKEICRMNVGFFCENQIVVINVFVRNKVWYIHTEDKNYSGKERE